MIEKLLNPIDAKQPAGRSEDENGLLEELEDLMLKYGSLHQNSIDWEKVEILGAQILTRQCKHYRVLLHLVTYWLNKRGAQGLLDSLKALSGFLERYWTDGHPNPGEANVRYRKKLTEQILFRIEQLAPRILKESLTATLIEALNAAHLELQTQLQQKQIEARLKKLAGGLSELKPNTPQTQKSGNAASASKQESEKKVPTKLADLGDERQLKRTLFDLADLLNRQNLEDPLGYELRRYALWTNIQSAPPLNRRGESELAPPPMDAMREYVDRINADSIDLELILRIEKSVVASPFWLMGSLYTAGALRKLEHRDTALAVLRTTEIFLDRLPTLDEGRFKGGTPYVDRELLERLQDDCGRREDEDDDENAQSPFSAEWGELQKEWTALRKEKGIVNVLEQVEKRQSKAATPRQAFYLKLLAGEQMTAAGLKHVAKDMLANTLKQVTDMPVEKWEPDYLQRAKTILESK